MRRNVPATRRRGGEDEEKMPRDFLVYRNGDNCRPVNFTYVPSQHQTWDTLLEAIERAVPPIDKEDRIEYLYTPKGRKKNRIRDLDHLEGTITDQLVACGADGFIEIPGGYEKLKDLPPSDLSGSDSEADSEYERKYGRPKPKGGASRMDGRRGGKRGKDLFVYLFQNGKGYRASPKVFFPHQLVKGIDFILEEISRHNSNKDVKGLYTMDGKEVAHLEDLKEAGAYVIVYKGQHFDDSPNYYIPEGAKDTSYQSNSDDDSPRGRGNSPKSRRNKKSRSRSQSPKRNRSQSPKRRSGSKKRSGSRSKRH